MLCIFQDHSRWKLKIRMGCNIALRPQDLWASSRKALSTGLQQCTSTGGSHSDMHGTALSQHCARCDRHLFVLQFFGVYYDDYMRFVEASKSQTLTMGPVRTGACEEVWDDGRWRRLFVYIRQVTAQ